jgi:hypothetical protein
MSASGQSTPGQRATGPWPRRIAYAIAIAIVVATLVGAIGIGYVFFRPAGPPPVGSESLVIPAGAVSTATPAP